jgi:hypothetical protein
MGVHPVVKDQTPAGGRETLRPCETCGRPYADHPHAACFVYFGGSKGSTSPMIQRFATGAERGTELTVRYDLIPWVGLRRVAETCAEGTENHGEHNWRLGLPTHDLINHTLAHVVRYMDGDRSEDHLAHAAWGLLVAMDNEERRPAMQDGLLGADGSLTDSIRLRLDRFRALRAAGKGEIPHA